MLFFEQSKNMWIHPFFGWLFERWDGLYDMRPKFRADGFLVNGYNSKCRARCSWYDQLTENSQSSSFWMVKSYKLELTSHDPCHLENTSYSTMLNIGEPVPPTESIPSNSRNSVYHFQHNSGIPGISSYQFLNGIPGFRIGIGSSLDG